MGRSMVRAKPKREQEGTCEHRERQQRIADEPLPYVRHRQIGPSARAHRPAEFLDGHPGREPLGPHHVGGSRVARAFAQGLAQRRVLRFPLQAVLPAHRVRGIPVHDYALLVENRIGAASTSTCRGTKEARAHLDATWERLAAGGVARMDLGEYPFSKRYGWVEDRYGINWQLMLTNPAGAPRPSVVPALLFTRDKAGQAEEAIEYYTSLFPARGEASGCTTALAWSRTSRGR
ncbi:MAG: VOC family protein [Myxococcota bacterium]